MKSTKLPYKIILFLKRLLTKKVFYRNFTIALVVASAISAILTYTTIANSSNPLGPDPGSVLFLVVLDLVFFLSLMVLVSRKLFNLWLSSKKKRSGTRLQSHIVLIFSIMTAAPTIIVTIFSTMFFNYGIQSWFDQRVSTALEESVEVAEAYFKEHIQLIRSDAAGMGQDINHLLYNIKLDHQRFYLYLSKQAEDRSLTEAIVFQTDPYNVISKSRFSLLVAPDSLPSGAMKEADNNNVVIMNEKNDNKVRALVKLDHFKGAYLLIARLVDSKVLDHMKKTQGAVSEYRRLNSEISGLQIKFLLVFFFVALLLLLISIWIGIMLASRVANPINKLVLATQKVKKGDFSIHIEEGPENDEVAILSKAFNSMTRQLEHQRSELIEANEQIDKRRHFSETVISSVTPGIIALNLNKKITMINPSAVSLISSSTKRFVGKQIDIAFPEISHLLDQAEISQDKIIDEEVKISRENKSLILMVRIVTEILDKKTLGYVITFDDITALVLAQRSAAWSDIARRIAHEIKNPLTPIHLAADRLNKKYSENSGDPETFKKYISTITRYVGDIGRMVEEFVGFARMPAPKFSENNIIEIIQDVVFSRKDISTNINYKIETTNSEVILSCDTGQISQALTNLIKNAEESILERPKDIPKGKIHISIDSSKKQTIIEIKDNGIGFPKELFDRLAEPYTTSKVTGTGLGLAIVKKIMDDHNAHMEFLNNKRNGALIRLIFTKD